MTGARPPAFARALLRIFIRGDAYEVIAGDLDEDFAARLASGASISDARREWRRQALASVRAVVAARVPWRGTADGAWVVRRWSFAFVNDLARDVRYAARQLVHHRGYAATAVLSLALGIGGTTAMYDLVYRLLLAPLPVDRPEEIGLPYWGDRAREPDDVTNLGTSNFRETASGVDYSSSYSYLQYTALQRAASTAGASLAAFAQAQDVTLSVAGQPGMAATAVFVSGNFFTTLRLPTTLGRALDDRDDASSPPAVVISHAFWERAFGADPRALGKTLRVGDATTVVVGVASPAFERLWPQDRAGAPDVVLALAEQPAVVPQWNRFSGGQSLFTAANVAWLRLLTRSATDRDDALTRALTAAYQQTWWNDAGRVSRDGVRNVHVHLFVGNHSLDPSPTNVARPLWLLLGVVAAVLLVACLNIAGLMLARGVARRQEFAVRRALGASRWRLARERLAESALLSTVGAAMGLIFAKWIGPLILAVLTGQGQGDARAGAGLTMDRSVLLATIGISVFATLVSGVLPAIASSADGVLTIRGDAPTHAPRLRVSRALLAIQIAAAVPLVVGAGLFLRTLQHLVRVDLGFDPRGLLVVRVDPTAGGRLPARAADVYPRLLARLSALPGVVSATLVENTPLSGVSDNFNAMIDGKLAYVDANAVGPRYFETLGVPLVAGRTLDAHDDASAPPVTVINETAAHRYFPGASALGRFVTLEYPQPRTLQIVGVVGDSKYASLRDPIKPTLFRSYLQTAAGRMQVVARVAVAPAALRTPIASAIAEIDPNLPATISTEAGIVDQRIRGERLMATLVPLFGIVALGFACVGIYGVTSYLVVQRTSEIGIRMALGATRAKAIGLIMRQMAAVAAAGVPTGVLAAWLAAPVVGSMLYGLAPRDSSTIWLAAVVITVATFGAAFGPARRAAKIDPLVALRME